MAGTTTRRIGAVGDDLFDKYLLPKLALSVILIASLVGTAVSTWLAGDWTASGALATWVYFVALGVLTGGLLWKHLFVRPADLESEAIEYCERMYERFDRIAVVALIALAVGGSATLARYASTFDDPLIPAALALSLVGSGLFVAIGVLRDQPVGRAFRSPRGVLALSLAVVAVVLTAVAEVTLQSGDLTATLVRILHLLAFTVWIGGAVWNIFVAVPTGQKRPTTPVIRAAGEQLERFRWTVRFIIPTLFATGIVQSIDLLGTALAPYLGTTVGLAILAKIGFIGLLVVIFKTCPMWRACSPIDGVCDLEDLDVADRSTPDGGAE